MAGAKRVTKKKCCLCEYYFDSTLITTVDKKNYCSSCFEKFQKEKKINKDLNDYIYKLCGEDGSLMPMMGSQIKKMKEENGYKASSILATLKYMYELKDPPVEFNPDYGVHDVIYFYHQAKTFNEKYFELKRKAEEDDIESPPDKIITIKRSSLVQEDEEFWKKKKEKEMGVDIDLNALILIDDESEGD